MKKLLSIILALCMLASVLAASGISVSAASDDEPVGATMDEPVGATITCGDYQYEVYNGAARIVGYTGKKGKGVDLIIPEKLDGYIVKYIKLNAFKGKSFETLRIPDTVIYIGYHAFYDSNIQYLYIGRNVELIEHDAFGATAHVYLPKSIKTINRSAFNFNKTIYYYEGSFEDLLKINIDPGNDLYRIQQSTYEGNAIIHYNCSDVPLIGQSKVVSEDFEIKLLPNNNDLEVGDIPLEAGIYELKVHKADGFYSMNGNNACGYNKTVNDSTTGGLTLNPKFKLPIKLVASGGVYRFIFNNKTNVLTIKRTGDLNVVCTVGDFPIAFLPIEGTNYSVASVTIPGSRFTYLFKISKGGKVLGVDSEGYFISDSRTYTISEQFNRSLSVTGMETSVTQSFIFNHDTNEITGYYNRIYPTNDIHIEGGLSITLDDNNGQSNIATATVNVEAGVYYIKTVDHGVAYGGAFTIRDNAYHNLKTNYKSSTLLIASGGTYTFNFNKTTGTLSVKKKT